MKKIQLLLPILLICSILFAQGNLSTETNSKDGKVLIIVSNSYYQGNSTLAAGNSFSEIVIAYHVFSKAGFAVDFLSPKGGTIPLSYINTSDSLQRTYLYDCDFMYALKYTRKPSEISYSDYLIVHYTGGSSPIFDIPQNMDIQKIVMSIYENNNGVVSAVCHGTSGIVNLKTKDGNYLVSGKNVNGVPDVQESKQLPHYQYYPFIIQSILQERGGKFKYSEIGHAHVEVDGRLVTGQNSLSSEGVALKSIEILKTIKK